ncbi:MAG: hypothetical protein ABJZ92_11410, partial [Cyclobacteriaceae bacterium]
IHTSTVMKHILTLALIIFCASLSSAQMDDSDKPMAMDEAYDILIEEWFKVSDELSSYYGLASFCDNADFRNDVLDVLNYIHHYDSLVLGALLDPTQSMDVDHKEYKKSMKLLNAFEEEYSSKKFIAHLKSNCGMYRELEREKDDLKGASGSYSYDGQIILIESDIQKYVKRIDKRVKALTDHVQLLGIEVVERY